MVLFESNGPFSLPTVLAIGRQMLDRLEDLHKENIVHADLKPENVTVGSANQSEIYLIDFGLSQTIKDADTLITPVKINAVLGTFKFMGIGAHQKIVSFKNDIESLAYMMLFFLSGNVPWDINALKDMKNQDTATILGKIHDLKNNFINAPSDDLPLQIIQFLAAVKNITYVERPNYAVLRDILK